MHRGLVFWYCCSWGRDSLRRLLMSLTTILNRMLRFLQCLTFDILRDRNAVTIRQWLDLTILVNTGSLSPTAGSNQGLSSWEQMESAFEQVSHIHIIGSCFQNMSYAFKEIKYTIMKYNFLFFKWTMAMTVCFYVLLLQVWIRQHSLSGGASDVLNHVRK